MHYVTTVVKALYSYDEDQDDPEIRIVVKSGHPGRCIEVAEDPIDLSVRYIDDAKVPQLNRLKM